MHLSEGVLHTPVLLSGAAVALVCVMIGLKRLNSQQLPLTALFAAAFFVVPPALKYATNVLLIFYTSQIKNADVKNSFPLLHLF